MTERSSAARETFAILLILACTTCVASRVSAQAVPMLERVWELDAGLDRPESVAYDPDRQVLYVSNIVGSPAAMDGAGYISRVSLDGEMIEERWVDSLHAPKGLALHEDRLFASDVDRLLEIDVRSGAVVGSHPAEDAEFLNDVAVDAAGRAYVSDSRGMSRIYRLADGMLHVWVEDDEVASPNGLFAEEVRLIVAAGRAGDDEPGMSRMLKAVPFDDPVSVVALPGAQAMGALDAIERSEHAGYFVTDWAGGYVAYFTPEGEVHVLEEIEQGTADLTYVQDLQMVFLPLMMSDRLVGYRVSWEP